MTSPYLIPYLDEYIVVLGIPKAEAAKVERLKKFITTWIKKEDSKIEATDVTLPTNEEGASVGVCFIKCGNSQNARLLAAKLDQGPFDKSRTVRVLLRAQYEALIDQKSDLQPVVVVPEPKEPRHFSWFLNNPKMQEQIVYIANKMPHAAFFNHTTATFEDIPMPQNIQSVDQVTFTPAGDFMVTLKGSTINFYGGEGWDLVSSYEHKNVKEVIFANDAPFMIAKAEILTESDYVHNPQGIAVFDTLMGTRILRLPLIKADFNHVFFAPGGHIVMRQGKDILVYRRIEGKREFEKAPVVLVKDIDSFGVSKYSPYIVVFKSARGASPPRITFYDLTTNDTKPIHSHVAYNAASIEIKWNSKYPMCAVAICPVNPEKNDTLVNIFDFRDFATKKNVATMHASIKGAVVAMDWDGSSHRLAFINDVAGVRHLNCYEVSTIFKKIGSFPCNSASRIQVSPHGRFAVTDDIARGSQIVQFWDLNTGLIKTREIENINGVEWDPIGCFILISADKSGYSVYMIDGNKICGGSRGQSLTSFHIAMWRPYQYGNLTDEDFAAIQDQLAATVERYGKFGIIDAKVLEEEIHQNKLEKLAKWRKFRNESSAYDVDNVLKEPVPYQLEFGVMQQSGEDALEEDENDEQ